MNTDDLRALLDAAGKATPGPCCFYSWSAAKDEAWRARSRECNCDHNEYCEKCWPSEFRKGGKWDKFEPPIAAASPDVVASLARIALASGEWAYHFNRPLESYDAKLFKALREEGLL